jgi:hypothetical protein
MDPAPISAPGVAFSHAEEPQEALGSSELDGGGMLRVWSQRPP